MTYDHKSIIYFFRYRWLELGLIERTYFVGKKSLDIPVPFIRAEMS